VLAPVLFARCQSAPGPDEQYLATQHVDSGAWEAAVCAPCPAGARCRGLPWEGVTNQPGWQRAEWDALGLTFLRCGNAGACPVQGAPFRVPAALGGGGNGSLPSAFLDLSGEWAPREGGAAPPLRRGQLVPQCDEGHTGHLCKRCEAGWSRAAGDSCAPCASPALQWLSLAGGLLLGGALLGYMIRTTLQGTAEAVQRGAAIKPYVALNKLLFSHLQQIAIAASFPMAWPPLLLRMFATFDTSASMSQDLVSVDCFGWGESAFTAGSVAQLLLPLVVVAVLGAVWGGVAAARCCRGAVAPPGPRAPSAGGGGQRALASPKRPSLSIAPGDVQLQLPGAGSLSQANPLHKPAGRGSGSPALPRSTSVTRARRGQGGGGGSRAARASIAALAVQGAAGTPPLTGFIVSLLVCGFLLHLSLTKTALGTLTCVQLAPGRSYLLGDLDISCSRGEWGALAAVGTAALLVYGLGIPLGSLALLWRHRGHMQRAGVKGRYGFLYMQYKPGAWYWESVTLMRKVGLAVIAVLLAPQGTGVQVMCSISLLVGSLLLHLMARPHVDERLNALEACSLVVAVGTLAGGAVLVDEAAPPGWRHVTSVAIVLLNASFIAAAVGALGWFALHDASLRAAASATVRHARRRLQSVVKRSASVAARGVGGVPRAGAGDIWTRGRGDGGCGSWRCVCPRQDGGGPADSCVS